MTTTIRTLTPKSWDMDRTREACELAARLILDGEESIDAGTYAVARGIFDPAARARRLETLARAEKIAAAHRAGLRWDVLDACIDHPAETA